MSAPIPRPAVLDPARELSDDREDMTLEEHRSRAQQLDIALREACDYGKQLWADVARARQYLLDSLPSDPEGPEVVRPLTSPTGPDDEAGWQRWQDAYSELTSVLTGPRGDSGMGRSEARVAAGKRRIPPASTPDEPAVEPAVESAAAEPDRDDEHAASDRGAAEVSDFRSLARPLALGVLVALALRGLRPARPRAR